MSDQDIPVPSGLSKLILANHPEVSVGGFSTLDGTISFYNRVNALVRPEFTVLDVGCGRGACGDDPVGYRRGLRILRGKVRTVIGLDVDQRAALNPFIDVFRAIPPTGRWPVHDASADLIVSDCVVEHLKSPSEFFGEAHRTLKVGGFLCIRTPNLLSYFGIASKLIPNRLHIRVLRKLQADRPEEDAFRTFYRCNTMFNMKRMFKEFGFTGAIHGFEAEPTYLAFSHLLYQGGLIYGRLAPSYLKSALFAFGVRS